MRSFLETVATTPVVPVPPVLQSLPIAMREQISATLANDEGSTDEEIVEFWTKECSIPLAAAEKAITFRGHFLCNPYFELFLENGIAKALGLTDPSPTASPK